MSGSEPLRDDTGWAAVFGDASSEIAGIADRLRAGFHAADPAVVEKGYPGYNSVNFGVGPRKTADGYGYVMAQSDRVNLGFYDGVDLPDPTGLLEGTGDRLRHVKVRTLESATSRPVEALIRAAVAAKRGVA